MTKEESQKNKYMGSAGGGSAVYGLGLIGALIYFIMHANTFGQAVIGILKGLVWPAIIVFKALEYFRA